MTDVNGNVEIKSNHQYQSHVGHHLEQLALFVLPSHNYESEGEDKEEGDESDRNDEEEDELSSRDDYPLPDGKSAYWSVAEMNEFPNLLKRYGPDWLAISRHMKTKTRIMVKSFFNRMVIENPQWQQIADEASVEPRLDGSNQMVENTKYSDDVPNASEQAGGSSHISPTDIQRGPQSEIDIDEAHRQESLLKYGDVPSGQDTSGFDQQSPSPGTIKWHGGEPVRTSNDGSAISFRTNEEIDLIENVGGEVRMKRIHSEEMADEHEIIRSMARRLKNASPEIRLQKCQEPGCNRVFKRPADLIKHEKTHSRPWKCPIESCKYHGYGWPTEKEMDRHYSDTHNIPPPRRHECLFPPCPYTCKRKDNLRSHMQRAHGWQDAETETNESDFGDQTSRVRIAEALGRIGNYFANPVLDPFEQTPGDERSDIYKSTTAKDYEQSGEISEGPVSEYFYHWDNIRRHDSNNEASSNAGKAEPQAPFTAEGSVHGLDDDWLKDQDIGSLPRPPETEMQTKGKDTEELRRSFTKETVEKRNVATENDAKENQEREKQTPEKESGRGELEFRINATVEERESQRVAWEEDMRLQAEQELRDKIRKDKEQQEAGEFRLEPTSIEEVEHDSILQQAQREREQEVRDRIDREVRKQIQKNKEREAHRSELNRRRDEEVAKKAVEELRTRESEEAQERERNSGKADTMRSSHDVSPPPPPVSVNETRLDQEDLYKYGKDAS
ncbi:hypothetical protein Daus18300_008129 [Diaporthe australafricana]|uniref:C2H2-type domain-containing protein n=1 Tax=Diaporthe australafricana TaxID=127596 RepID=A0ABR3WJQ3_9PEZI